MTTDRLWMFASDSRSACGTGAVARARIRTLDCSLPSCLPRVMLKRRLLLTTSRLRPPNSIFPVSIVRALMMTLIALLASFVWAMFVLPVSMKCDKGCMPTVALWNCLVKS